MEWLCGEIQNEKLHTEFVKIDEREFIELEVSIEQFYSKEDLIMAISGQKLDENNLYKIVLTGKRNFEIDTREILRLIPNENILKIKDCTETNYDIEEIAKENNLRGYFVREVIKKYNDGLATEEEIKKAIEIGLEAM